MTLVQAQERTYTGTVSSAEDGMPIIGASVEIVGTTQGATTGVDGSFSLRARPGSQLRFSFLGMESQVITLGNTTVVNVVLASDATGIEEVVVVAYGTVKKRDLTGSISTIDSKLIGNQATSSLTRSLEGAIPGLQISAVDGQPGLDMGIRIRGIGTASQNNANALIVIDGVPTQNANALATLNSKDVESITVLKDAASTALWGSRGANGVLLITTKRGQLGKPRVTFEGRWGMNMIANNGKPDLMRNTDEVYEYYWQGIYNSVLYSHPTDQFTSNLQNPNMTPEAAAEFASAHLFDYTGSMNGFSRNHLYNWMYYNVPGAVYQRTGSGTTASSTMSGAYLINPQTGKINTNATRLYEADDWEELVYNKPFRHEYNLSVSGATDRTDYFISAGYLNDPSYVEGSKFERFSVRSNINTQVTKWLKAGLNIGYSRRETQSPATRWGRNPGTTAQNVFLWANGYNAMASYYQRDKDGNFVYDENGNIRPVVLPGRLGDSDTEPGRQYSPVGPTVTRLYNATTAYDLKYQLENDKDLKTTNDISLRGQLEAKFLRDFSFRVNMNYDEMFEMRRRYANNVTGTALGARGYMGRAYSDYRNINSQQILNWGHDYGKHHVDAMIGHEFTTERWSSLNYRSSYSLINNFDTFSNFIFLNGGDTFSGPGGSEDKEALEAYFARANYIYDSKYYLTASIRMDGSSKFRYTRNRWGAFWSVGAAWRISSERWMEGSNSWLNDLKLRADYGVIGNQNGVHRYSGYTTWSYAATAYSTPGSYNPTGWRIGMGRYADSNLTWEKKRTVDVGLDFLLWNRFSGVLDWYQSNTVDMIWPEPTSIAMTGQATIDRNSAAMRTRGFEFEFGVEIMKSKDFDWSVNLNGAHYRSILTKVPDGVPDTFEASVDAWAAQGAGGSANMPSYLRGVGLPYYNMYIFKYGGVDSNTGLPMFMATVSDDNRNRLLNTKGTVTTQDGTVLTDRSGIQDGDKLWTTDYDAATREEFGDVTPTLTGGFGTNFRWKNLDLNMQFSYQIGGKFLSVGYAGWYYYTDQGNGHLISTDLRDSWTPTNTGAEFPMNFYKPLNSQAYNNAATIGSWKYTDQGMFNASYLTLRNLTLGYNFPQRLMDRIGIEAVRVYASLDNFWTWGMKSGVDYRMSIVGGMDVGAMVYPYPRTCSLGLNITF